MMARMDAWTVVRPGPLAGEPLRRVARPPPEPAAGEVRVRVLACGVCRTDLHVVEGDLPVRRPGVVPGHQVAGVVDAVGAGVARPACGERVGVAWVRSTCGSCRWCTGGRENLCPSIACTGWTHDGGFAEYVCAPAAFVHALPEGFDDLQAAPLLCAGVIGYRALRLAAPGEDLARLRGMRLGIHGFGAAGHVVIQVARWLGAEVYVATRDRERHARLAAELGAAWTGGAFDVPPVPLDAAIVFAPAGDIVPAALRALDRGGRLVLGGIHMTPIPALPYEFIYLERSVQSVANNTRADARALLALAPRIPIRTQVQPFPLADAPRALHALRHDAVRGAAVLVPGS
jgi:propanol-preferring alcohol dehydrogenase